MECLRFPVLQGGGNALLEARDALVVHVLDRRQVHGLDRLAGVALDDAQHVALARCHEQDRITVTAGAAGAPDTMGVGLGVIRDVVVDDVRDALDVDAAGGDIGGHHDVELPVLEARNRAFALCLRNITVQFRGIETAGAELLSKLRGLELGAHEHQHGIEAFRLEHPRQRVQLVQAADQPVALADERRRRGLLPNRDFHRIAHVLLRDAPDGIGHGGREQRDLTPRGGLRQDPLDVIDETHLQHLIAFIQHDEPQ